MRQTLFKALALIGVCITQPLTARAADFTAVCKPRKIAEIPMALEHTHPFVDVSLNGKPLKLALDTGAAFTAITEKAQERLKLPISTSTTHTLTGMFGSDVRSDAVVSSLQISGIPFKTSTVAVTAEWDPNFRDGVIGADFLSQYDVDFDFPSRKMVIYEPDGCAPIVDVTATQLISGSADFMSQGRMLIRAQIENAWLYALIDTGASAFAITESAAVNKLGRTKEFIAGLPTTQTTGIGSAFKTAPMLGIEGLRIGDFTAVSGTIPVTNTVQTSFDMIIGMQYLQFQRFWVSYRFQRVVPIESFYSAEQFANWEKQQSPF